MALVTLRDVSLSFHFPLILDGVNLQIEPGERVCLLGRNGSGKTSLMRLIHGDIEPDEGELARQQGLVTAMLPQEVPRKFSGSVFDEITRGLGPRAELLAEYHHVSGLLAAEGSDSLRKRLDRIHHKLETEGGWLIHQEVETVISRMSLDGDADVTTLSAGMKRRVLLAKALVGSPSILLLDEPTNHLDIDAIRWLEDFLLRSSASLLFVTHDRAFLRRLATRILELDRGRLTSWSCDYDTFVKRKEAALEAEERQRAEFDKKLAREEVWIRTGIRARRTRNEGRVRALQKLRETRRDRREQPGEARMEIQEAERSGRMVIEAKHVNFSYGDNESSQKLPSPFGRGVGGEDDSGSVAEKHSIQADGPHPNPLPKGEGTMESKSDGPHPNPLPKGEGTMESKSDGPYPNPPPKGEGAMVSTPIVADLSTMIMRGDRVGLIGPNGSGKTTLLRLLLGELRPKAGSIRHGTNLEVAYFDQLHAQLDDDKSVRANVGEGSDWVEICGRKRHVIGYLADFLFTNEQAESPVARLSGGERNRLVLARLFTKPSNVLVMDEPTNDLDIETLELLEDLLMDYPGTLLLVSHDREFLNNVVTSTLALEGEGRVKEYAGGYDDWLRQRKPDEPPQAEPPPENRTPTKPPKPRARRLTYKEQRELETLPERIAEIEAELSKHHETMADPLFYKREPAELAKAKTELQSLEKQVAEAYERWEELDTLGEKCGLRPSDPGFIP